MASIEDASTDAELLAQPQEEHPRADKPLQTFNRITATSDPPEWPEWADAYTENRLAVSCCYGIPGPACWPLIEEPFAVLTDRSRWPDHLCVATIRESLSQWGKGTFLKGEPIASWPDPRANFLSTFPMPVGTIALRHWSQTQQAVYAVVTGDKTRQPFDDYAFAMPWDDNVFAILILTARLRRTTVRMFGLQEQIDGDFRLANMRIRSELINSEDPNPKDPDTVKLQKDAREWWSRFTGRTLAQLNRGGRPPGSGKLDGISLDSLMAMLVTYCRDDPDSRDPHTFNLRRDMKEGFARSLGVHQDTLDSFLRGHNSKWRQLYQKYLETR